VARRPAAGSAKPVPLVVPVLRAGLGHARRHDPAAADGRGRLPRHGAQRGLARGTTYATRLPDDLSGREVFVLDPMLATGGTLVATIELLVARGAPASPPSACCAPPRASRASTRRSATTTAAPVTVVTRGRRRLDERGYITPGLGDAGDRLYGVV
jgi:uracil phosphoribosyltransferase